MSIDPTRAPRLIVAAAVVGFALRLAFGIGYWQHRPLTHDEREYLALARNLTIGKGFVYDAPAAEGGSAQRFGRAPGYPFFLTVIGAGRDEFDATPTRVKLAQALVGGAGVWLIGLIASRFSGHRAGVAAAAIAAVYPPLVWICSYVFSEALYSTLALAAVVLLNRALDRGGVASSATGIVGGVAVGLAILVRPAMLLFLPVAALWLIAQRRTPLAVVIVVAAALVVAPWTIRNARVYHRFVLVASEGGVTFWTGNHPRARGEGDLAANPDLKVADLAFRADHSGLTAEELEPLYYRDAIRSIANDPLRWVGLLVKKAFYTIVPAGPSYALHSPLYRFVSIASYLLLLPVGLLGAVHWWRRPHRPEALLPLAASAVMVCLVFFPQERFRIPVIDPALIVFAGGWYGTRRA